MSEINIEWIYGNYATNLNRKDPIYIELKDDNFDAHTAISFAEAENIVKKLGDMINIYKEQEQDKDNMIKIGDKYIGTYTLNVYEVMDVDYEKGKIVTIQNNKNERVYNSLNHFSNKSIYKPFEHSHNIFLKAGRKPEEIYFGDVWTTIGKAHLVASDGDKERLIEDLKNNKLHKFFPRNKGTSS